MIRKTIPLLLILFTLAACSFQIDIPVKNTGQEATEEISIPAPNSPGIPRLYISFGAGELFLSPGSDQLVTGTATFNIQDLRPEITTIGSTVSIVQGDYHISGIPSNLDIVNEWSLQLGSTPLDLEIEAGAYHAEYDFGGLALTNLTIQDGASDVELAFSAPNQAEMSLLRYETGASNVTLNGLANANFSNMQFECGAGNYTLDFSGELKRSATITIEAGLGNLTLIIPEGLSVSINVESGLSNINIPSGWSKNGDIYTQAGSGPTLSFIVEIGAGNLTIRN